MPVESFITNPREYMELAVETMLNSKSEKRTDKSNPLVGAVLVFPDRRVETACRGELSDGDHAEYTLFERKLANEDLSGAVLFVTLEPCAIGARSADKTACAKRIVKRRISKVWVGIEDPDPHVDSKGFKYLEEHGVIVELFDRDLQESIRQANVDFIRDAEERASQYREDVALIDVSELEAPILDATLDDLSEQEIRDFIKSANEFKFEYGTDEFFNAFARLRYLARDGENVHPTKLGILLFGEYPQIFFPHAVIRATLRTTGRNEDIETFSGSLPKQAKDCHEWVKKVIRKQIDRSNAERKVIYDYPIDVIRESVNNALAHRSYDIEGGSIHVEICDDHIIIRSPGGPVKPISLEKMINLDAPYLSKNPKITYVFEKLDLCESRGLGFTTIRNLPAEHKLPLPIVTFNDPFLNFSFSRAYGNGNGKSNDERDTLSKSEAKGYDYIRLNSPITRKMYEDYFGVAGKTARRHLVRFAELNLIKKVGAGPSTSYEIV